MDNEGPMSKTSTSVNAPVLEVKDGTKPRFAGLYREDVVQSASHPGMLGLVSKVAGDSDSDDSDDDEDTELDSETLTQGYARISWANSEESTHKIDEIKVIDRSFMHGNYIARVSSPMGQTGTVVNVHLKVDLQLPSGEILSGIDSEKLRRFHPFVVGDFVVHKHWLGRVDEVVENVTVKFDDGAKCKVSRAEPDRLIPLPATSTDDSDYPYYPGQRVRASFSGLFKSARWLKGCWKSNRMEGTVVDLEVNSVMIHWMAAAHVGGTDSQAPKIPAEKQNPNNITRLKNFSYVDWQLGDRALLAPRISRKDPVKVSTSAKAESPSDGESEVAESSGKSECNGQIQASEGSEVGKVSSSGVKDSATDSWVGYRRKLKRRLTKHKKKLPKKDDFFEAALPIVGTSTKVDVLWQDGTRELGIDASTLFPVDHLGDHDFFPEQHVIEKGSEIEGSEIDTNKRVGVVKSVDAKQRTAIVRWLAPSSHPQKLPCFEKEEIVSVYELMEHPDYDYCLGDVVIRLCPCVGSTEVSDSQPDKQEAGGMPEVESGTEHELNRKASTSAEGELNGNKPQFPPTEVREKQSCKKSCEQSSERPIHENSAKADGNKDLNDEDLSWVGIITDLQDGQVQVAWANGVVSKVGTQAIFVVGRDEDDASTESVSEIGEEIDDAASWTTVDSADMNDLEEKDDTECTGSDVMEQKSMHHDDHEGQDQKVQTIQSKESTVNDLGNAFSLPLSALIRALKFAVSFLWALRGPRRSLVAVPSSLNTATQCDAGNPDRSIDQHMETSDSTEILTADNALQSKCKPAVSTADSNSTVLPNSNDSAEAIDAGNEVTDKNILLNVEREHVKLSDLFKSFDSVKDSADHNFRKESSQPSNPRHWSRKVQQEWTVLEKSLPDTIFVRVYEDRMDLMRAVILGAAGTPYHHGLFFFDLHLPSDYPTVPPLVHYHSGGLRLNPNLYETGKVCLSLLNTWTGKGNEIWNPSTSSILQVLISIQGLVLNANPYYNEAGYDKQIGTAEGEKNSLAYAENSFLLSCKSMLYVIRRPPKHFEDFVRQHFKRQGLHILKACKAYMQGSPVGSLLDDGSVSPSYGKESEQCSAGFRLMLAKIIPRLVTTFKELGVDSEQC